MATDRERPAADGHARRARVRANKLAIALQVREAAREHRRGRPIAFVYPRVPESYPSKPSRWYA